MLCRAIEFQEFLGTMDETSAAVELCKRCGITSRSELNGNEEAQMAFDAIVLEYKTGVNNDLF
jgi:hypothetical protein